MSSDFGTYLRAYEEHVPAAKSVHYEYHSKAIRARTNLGSVAAAIDDDRFLGLVRETLLAWGIGVRGQHLVSDAEFRETFMDKKDEISRLDGLHIDDPSLDLDRVVPAIWRIIGQLRIVETGPKLVPCSKALHHLLPDLVIPVDRLYTRIFFQCRRNTFDGQQQRFFDQAFRLLARLAREVSPAQYVGDGWCTSRTKVLDNAVAGYCKVHPLGFY